MHPANQKLRKLDKLSQGAHKQTSYPRVQWEITLDKRGGYRTPETQEREKAGNPVSCEPERGECKVKEQSRI